MSAARDLLKMKERYDRISVPEELDVRVRQEVQKSRERQEEKSKSGAARRFRRMVQGLAAGAAACIFFVAALNMSPVFAMEAAQLPVIGGIARVLTFRSLASEKDNIGITVEIPAIEVIAGHERMTADEINEEISSLCKQYEEEAVLRAEEYKNAFLETGGTPEEWAEHELEITVWYEIKQQSRDYLSFVVKGAQSWTNGNGDSRYYNLDLRTGTIVTLRDMLGDHYIERANESIREQIYERQQAGEAFFAAGEGGFSGISEDAKFYINENNRPVIVFEKYEIAPGASGEIEFEIGED